MGKATGLRSLCCMVAFHGDACDKCWRRNPVNFHVSPRQRGPEPLACPSSGALRQFEDLAKGGSGSVAGRGLGGFCAGTAIFGEPLVGFFIAHASSGIILVDDEIIGYDN